MTQWQIVGTTDGKFVGLVFTLDEPLVLEGALFLPDKTRTYPDGVLRLSNSNYVIDAQEV